MRCNVTRTEHEQHERGKMDVVLRLKQSLVVLLALCSAPLAAATGGVARYQVQLTEAATAAQPPAAVAQQLAATYGGELDASPQGDRFTIRLDEDHARLLGRDQNVAAIRIDAATPSRTAKPSTTETGSEWFSQYSYDGSGNITDITAENSGAETYRYDALGRLTNAHIARSGVTADQTLGYDPFGNLTGVGITPSSVCVLPCSISAINVDSATNRLSGSSVAYDEAGSQTVLDSTYTYAYDGLGMMTRQRGGGVDRQYIYTPNEERIAVYSAATWQWNLRDLGGRLVRTFTSTETTFPASNTLQWNEDYIYRGDAMLASEQSSGSTRHFHLDHLSTPRIITDDTARSLGMHAYLPFGAELSIANRESPEESKKFTGHERDTLPGDVHTPDYMHARYYAGGWGRFLSVDPSMDLKKTIRNPQMWNRYSYVLNNPLRFTDPDGREHVNEPGFTKSLADADWSDAPTEVKAAFWIGGGATTLAVGGGAFGVGRQLAFEASLLMMRNPAAVLTAYKLLDSMGGNVSGHVNPTGQTGGKLGYLLGSVESQASQGKGGFFAGVMGFGARTLDAAIRSHFADNFENGVLQKDGRLAVTGAMTGANGVIATVKTVWQWNKDNKVWDLITAVPAR